MAVSTSERFLDHVGWSKNYPDTLGYPLVSWDIPSYPGISWDILGSGGGGKKALRVALTRCGTLSQNGYGVHQGRFHERTVFGSRRLVQKLN
jgi:hypothetical protein